MIFDEILSELDGFLLIFTGNSELKNKISQKFLTSCQSQKSEIILNLTHAAS